MPTIPEYNLPTVGPARPQTQTQSAAGATAEAFGAQVGAESQRLGQSFDRVASQFEQTAQQWQRDENETVANEATINFMVESAKIQERFKQLQGKDPSAAMQGYTNEMKALASKMRGQLTNPEVQRMFDQQTTRQLGYAIVNMGSHAATQFRSYQQEQRKAIIDTNISAAASAETERVFEGQLKAIEDNTRQGMQGSSEEAIQAAVRTAQGKAWSQRIETMALTDPAGARSLLDRKRASVDGIVAQNLDKYIAQQDMRVSSLRIANGVMMGGATDTAQQKQDWAMSYLTSKWGKTAAAAIVGNLVAESGMNTAAVNPGDGADGSDSIGLAQWNAERAKNLKKFAADRGMDWKDFKTQVQFIDHELTTSHAHVGQALRAAGQDLTKAGHVVIEQYEVPAGSNRGAQNAKHYDRRMANAARLNGSDVQPIMNLSTGPGQREALTATARKEAEAYARSQGFDDAQRDLFVQSTLQRLDSQYARQAAVQRDADAGARGRLIDHVMGGPDGTPNVVSIDQVMGPEAPKEVRDAYLSMQPKDQLAVRRMIERNAEAKLSPAKDTPETRANRIALGQMMVDDPDKFLNVNPLDEKLVLTQRDHRWLAQQQEKLRSNRANADELATSKRAVDQAVAAMRANGLLDITGLRNAAEVAAKPQMMAQLRGALVQELDAWNVKHPGERPNEKELLEIGRRIVQERTSEGWFFGLFGGGKTLEFKPEAATKPPPAFDDIPKDFIAKVQEQHKARGLPPPDVARYRTLYDSYIKRSEQSIAR